MERKIISIDYRSFMNHEDVETTFKAFGKEWTILISRDTSYQFNYKRFHLKIKIYVPVPNSMRCSDFEPPYCEHHDYIQVDGEKIQPLTVYVKYRGEMFAFTMIFTYPEYENVPFHVFIKTPTRSIIVERYEYRNRVSQW